METPFEAMKRYVRFTRQNAEALAAFRAVAAPHFGWLSDQFYDRLLQHEAARRVFSGPEQVERLKSTLQIWADRLLSGPHDEPYYELRARIGRVHVEVGLPQVYMFTAMNVIREAFREIAIKEIPRDDARRDLVLVSINKLLDLELAIMLESYREEYLARLHRSEQQAALKRLAAIGEVAASLAHEVRNPLAGISGAIEVLRDDLPSGSPRRAIIGEVLGEIRRLNERVRDLLLYARHVRLSLEPVEPDDLIRGTLALLSEEPMMRGVTPRVTVAGGLGRHSMDRGQMMEVLVNLIRNAADAMQGRGALYLEAHRRDGGGLELIVEDTGPGVPPELTERIFAPFVTTRPEGTGLGLSICRRTLEAHGGSLVVERGREGGARFVAVLPADPPAGEPEGAAR